MADFNLAIPTVLENEGGYVNDPNDPGGETKYGISKRRYPNEDIKNLTVERATELYLRDFWIFGGIEDQTIATKIFDAYVNMEHTAIRIMQSLLQVVPDGLYGKQTEAAINGQPDELLDRYRAALAQHYRDLVDKNPRLYVFLRGWLRRAEQ